MSWAQGESVYTQINSLLRKGDIFEYLYDMGDDWKHEIKVEDIMKFTSKMSVVLESIGGARKKTVVKNKKPDIFRRIVMESVTYG